MKTGLVLEGGALRGMYTSGVLDALLDGGVRFDYVIGVSAGACNAASFVSRQRGRSRRINMDYLDDKRYLSVNNLIKTRSLFGMDFIFDQIPNVIDPFDYEAYERATEEFVVGVTDAQTGRPFYFAKREGHEECTVLRASSAIPAFSMPVELDGGVYFDGGTSDPIPVEKALADGCDRVLVVLTRPRDYVKKPESMRRLYTHALREYPRMIEAMDCRHEHYNHTLEALRQREKEGRALVIAPEKPLDIGRFEKDKLKLERVYQLGLADGRRAVAPWADFCRGEAPEIRLKELTLDDVDAVFALTGDPRVTRYMRFDTHTNREQAAELIAEYTAGANHGFGVYGAPDGPLLGVAALKEAGEPGVYDMSLFLSPDCWGKRFGGTAQAALHKRARQLGARRLQAYVQGGNTASRKLLERRGYQVARVLKIDGYADELYIYELAL